MTLEKAHDIMIIAAKPILTGRAPEVRTVSQRPTIALDALWAPLILTPLPSLMLRSLDSPGSYVEVGPPRRAPGLTLDAC